MQLLQMSDAQIEALPMAQKQQIIMLKQQFTR
jgi:hypothetical protein